MHKMKEKYYKKKASSILASSIVIITSLVLISTTNSSNASAETSTATIRVKSTCSMTATILPGEEHTASLVNGIYSGDYTDTSTNTKPYENGIGKTTIQTFCNDPNGYAIYAIGYTGGDIGVANGTNTVLHSTALGSTYDIATGTATSGDISNWSMKLTALGDTSTYKPDILNGYNNYSIIPSDYTKVASYGSNTDTATIGSSLTTTYAAYISPTQPAGTYTGQVKYVLVHPASSLEPSSRYMQDVDQWANDIDVGDEVVAYDNRDNKSYTVRRMCMESSTSSDATWQEKEENCTDSMLWMTQNLDLCIGCTGTNALTSENTNITEYQKDGVNFADYTISGDGLVAWEPTASTMTGDPASISNSTVSGYINSNYIPSMVEGGDRYSYQGTRYNSLEDCKTAGHSATECAHYHIGNYYNWSAAVAMSDTSAYTTDYTVMPNSICPKGWRLPNGITQDPDDNTIKVQSDFNKLLSKYDIANSVVLSSDKSVNAGWKTNGFANIGLDPLYFVRSGLVDGWSLRNLGMDGGYWSSTVINITNAYGLYYYSSELFPAHRSSRYYGWSIRCVSDYK